MPIEPAQQFLAYMRNYATQLRSEDTLPTSLDDWQALRARLRVHLQESFGDFPSEPCDLEPRMIGSFQRAGYRVEKLTLQTRPGILMTANAYVPDSPGKHPAVLCVHGHWKGAKQDPVVQSRCIGLAKLGFFVLAVDAFGAGERAIGKALGEYHGEMAAATLLPVGKPLPGLQVYENSRAVDYLLTRPEVDGERLGVTGASGGGNQTMYAGALDERFKAVVPVCSVGTYHAYIGAACCLCELVPGAISYTEEWGLLSLVAPRALMVINATRDAFQFSVGEAQQSIARAQHVYRLYQKAGHIKHDIFESGHDYGKAMRESMYGWMTLHLKGEGLGSPIPEPEFDVEEPETLRCFPGDSRPETFITLPQFAAREAQATLSRWENITFADADDWQSNAIDLKDALVSKVFGGWPKRSPMAESRRTVAPGTEIVVPLETEPGIEVTATLRIGRRPQKLAVLIDLEGARHAAESPLGKLFEREEFSLLSLDLRGTGRYAVPGDTIARAPDHNSAEWAIWSGRPLLGQWAWDVRQVMSWLADSFPGQFSDITFAGEGPGCLVALCAAVTLPEVRQLVLDRGLTSYVTAAPYVGQRLGILAPGILNSVGDVAQLAALFAPRLLVIHGAVNGQNEPLSVADSSQQFAMTRRIYEILGAGDRFRIQAADEAVQLIEK